MLKKLLLVAALVAKLGLLGTFYHQSAIADDCPNCPPPNCFPGECDS